MKAKTLSSCILLLTLAVCQQLESTAWAAVTFNVTPSAVSNFYAGVITLQIGGLNTGETVRIDKFLDVNNNGVIDAADWPVQSFLLTDGQASVFYDGANAVTNINVPGDFNPTNGVITAQLRNAADITQEIVAQYLFRLSSPTNHFTPLTNLFNVTNSAYAQSFTGAVKYAGTNVPNVVVMVAPGSGQHSSPIAGVMANSSGNYTLNLPGGTYSFMLFKSNYVANLSQSPTLTLTNGTTFTTNLTFLVAATNRISGSLVDAANTNAGLPGIFMVCETPDNQFMAGACYTGTNGAFSVPVISGQWKVSMASDGLAAYGYVDLNDHPQVDTTTGNVSNVILALPKATALFYGHALDSQSHPFVGLDISCQDNNNLYQQDFYTDANGYYLAPAVGGLANDAWQVQVSSDSAPANCIFSQPPFNQNGGTNINTGQAVLANLTGLIATNHITGRVTNAVTGQGIANVGVPAWATINGVQFMAYARTDSNGFYSNTVGNGTWSVTVNCGDCSDCLGSQYLCPNNQTVTIANNSTNLNFAALLPTSQINGHVKDNSNNAISNVNVYAYMPSGGGGGPGPGATTDSSGYYSFYVANGSWNVGVNCCGDNGLNPLGYLCVGEQSTNVFNSTNTVNFSVPRAPHQITGHLRDGSNNGIANVGVNAGSDTYSACATTDSNGFYTLYVASGTWNVNLNCDNLGALGYLCPGNQTIPVNTSDAVADFSTVQALYTISGWIRNSGGQPFTNLDVQASASIGANDYWLDVQTDSNGNYSFQVANGLWSVDVDCGGLGNGYLCPDELGLGIAGASVVTNLTIQSCGVLQILTTSPLPAGQVGSYYDFYFQASSCNPNFNWAITSGSLPSGLTGDPSSGEIYGTPTNSGTYTFTVQVTDGNNATTNQAMSVTIAPPPQDVVVYYVMKMESFLQTTATIVAPDSSYGPFNGILGIVQATPGTVPIANVDLPTGGVRGFPPGGSGMELEAHDSYATQAALDAVYTNGNYTFAIATLHNGFQFPVLAMPVVVYPAAQRIINYPAAQAITPANSFTLQWSNSSDATTNDLIWVFINDASGNMVFSTPEPSTSPLTALTGAATSVVVPASTFRLGATYTGAITFYRNTGINTAAYPGAAGVTLVGTRTRFSMTAPSASLPVLSQPARISATQFGFQLTGATGQNYTVLASTNAALHMSNWSTVLTTNLSTSPVFIQDNQATNKQRYYRVKVGP